MMFEFVGRQNGLAKKLEALGESMFPSHCANGTMSDWLVG